MPGGQTHGEERQRSQEERNTAFVDDVVGLDMNALPGHGGRDGRATGPSSVTVHRPSRFNLPVCEKPIEHGLSNSQQNLTWRPWSR